MIDVADDDPGADPFEHQSLILLKLVYREHLKTVIIGLDYLLFQLLDVAFPPSLLISTCHNCGFLIYIALI